MKNILVVDDEQIIAENIKQYLLKEGYNVYIAHNGKVALDIFNSNSIDMLILDLMIPKISGEEVCKKVRKESNIPIVMLTAKVTEENRINGLEIGADVYVTKPFSIRELMVIVRSLFRRVSNFAEDNYIGYNRNILKIDYDQYKVLKNNIDCNLTKRESLILFALSKHPNKIFTREELIEIAMGNDFEGYDRAIDTHIKNLRSKIEDDTSNPEYIITIRGVGYRFGAFND